MFVLQDSLATKKRGKPVYFGGTKYTESCDDAEKFDSAHDAMQSPAYVHSMCFFEPVEI